MFLTILVSFLVIYSSGSVSCVEPSSDQPSSSSATGDRRDALSRLTVDQLVGLVFHIQADYDIDYGLVVNELKQRFEGLPSDQIDATDDKIRGQVVQLSQAGETSVDKCYRQGQLMLYHSLLTKWAQNVSLKRYISSLVAKQSAICLDQLNHKVESELAEYSREPTILDWMQDSLAHHQLHELPSRSQMEELLAEMLVGKWQLIDFDRDSVLEYLSLQIIMYVWPKCYLLSRIHRDTLRLHATLTWFAGSHANMALSQNMAKIVGKARICHFLNPSIPAFDIDRVAELYRQMRQRRGLVG